MEDLKLTHSEIADYLINYIVSEMTTYLMEDYGISVDEALDIIYKSNVIKLLQMIDCELYVQSPAYVYELLLKEVKLYPSLKLDDKNMSIASEDPALYNTK